MQSEINRSQKDKYSMIPHIQVFWNNKGWDVIELWLLKAEERRMCRSSFQGPRTCLFYATQSGCSKCKGSLLTKKGT